MKKSKHFRKDVILARIIAGVILLVLIALLFLGISLLKKTSGDDKNSQNSQNTQNSENLLPEDQDTETEEDVQQTENEGNQGETEENDDTTYEPDKVYVKTTVTLRLRAEPNTNCDTLAHIPGGTKLEVIEPAGGWFKVIYEGKTGYVSGVYAKVVEE